MPLRAYSRSLPTVLLATQQAISPAFREVYNTVGLTPPQWRVLRVLWEQDGRTISALATTALLDKPVVVGVVDRLTKAGLVVRTRDDKDRRQVFVWLTEAGREVRTVAGPKITAIYQQLDEALTESEWTQLYALLERIENHKLRSTL